MLLTVSLVVHSAIVVGAVAMSVINVEFPERAPNEFGQAPVLVPLSIPPPLGSPTGGAPPRRETAAPPSEAAAARAGAITAPAEVPETVSPVHSGTGGADSGLSSLEGDGQPLGVPWGEAGSIGDLDAPPPLETAVEQKIYEAAEVNAPVLVLKVEPTYPVVMMRTRMAATVVVRCVIDRNGHVRDAQIVSAAMPPFNDAVLAAVSKWRFRPGTLRGQPVDTYLNLTVNFAMR
ncbi:MAG TPA: energy transducer TonB [Thermoanaerobaculia bacterium]